jgi:hypothetical protein
MMVTDYEREKSFPSLQTLDIIHCKFFVNLNWLISGEGKMIETGRERKDYVLADEEAEYHRSKHLEVLERYYEIAEELLTLKGLKK